MRFQRWPFAFGYHLKQQGKVGVTKKKAKTAFTYSILDDKILSVDDKIVKCNFEARNP